MSNLAENIPQEPESQKEITIEKWIGKVGTDTDKDISSAKVKGKVKVLIQTKHFKKDDTITVTIIDAADNSELTTATATVEATLNAKTAEITIADDWNNKTLKIIVKTDCGISEEYKGKKKLHISCCEHALVRGDSGDLIKELNIRLAGFGEFGCPLPQNKFDERTEKAVKQFQRDYMKVEPTGIACKDFLEKLDKFCEDYLIKIDNESNFKVKCPCVNVVTKQTYHCTTGFGSGRNTGLSHTHTYNDGLNASQTYVQSYNGTEKPGIHRSLLWAISAMKFYLDKVETSENLKIGKFESSYRCKGDNIVHFTTGSYSPKQYHPLPPNTPTTPPPTRVEKKKPTPRTSNNHMGNAIDIHIYPSSSSSGNTLQNADVVRKLFVKYSSALIRWPQKNAFSLEPSKKVDTEFIATNWVHIDCREFNDTYKDNAFYCANETALKGSTFQSLYSSNETDGGKWTKISDCAYAPTAQATIPARVDEIWLGMVDIPDSENGTKTVNGKTETVYKKTLTLSTENGKQVWKATEVSGNANRRNQCVVEILEEVGTEYKIKPKGQTSEGWINKNWVIEVVKFKE